MNLVGELVLARNQILQFSAVQLDSTFVGATQRLNLVTSELQEGVMKTRMQPSGNIWSKFPRVVRRDQDVVNIVVLKADDRQFGLVVDAVNDTEEIVVKPLGKQFKSINVFAGATIMGDGRVALILDVQGVAQRAGVVSRVARAAIGNADDGAHAHTAANDARTLLLFRVGEQDRMAIPLDLVARLEEFPASHIEHSGDLPITHLVKYFDKQGLEWELKPKVRTPITYDMLNLVKPWPATMGPFDLVMLRNVMIYFDVPTKTQILDRVQRVLRSDGYLFLGSAETTMGIHDGYTRQPWGKTGYYRLSGGAAERNGGR